MTLQHLLAKAMVAYMDKKGITTLALADEIRLQQINDIPEPTERVRFNDDSTAIAIESNSKTIQRYINDGLNVPLKLVPTIIKVINDSELINELCGIQNGFFVPYPEVLSSGDEEITKYISECLKETGEFIGEICKDWFEDRKIDRKDLSNILKKGNEALQAIKIVMVWAEKKYKENERRRP